jgi:hypothetical protein
MNNGYLCELFMIAASDPLASFFCSGGGKDRLIV